MKSISYTEAGEKKAKLATVNIFHGRELHTTTLSSPSVLRAAMEHGRNRLKTSNYDIANHPLAVASSPCRRSRFSTLPLFPTLPF